jgi:pimeloyl-ACP methyl ester carboxylesterase
VPPATYATIRQPVLLVTGRDSPPAFREMTATLARTLPSARTVVVAGGHEINPDHAHLLGFLTEHTQTRKSHDP